MKAIVLVMLFGFTLPGEVKAAASSCYVCTSATHKGCNDKLATSIKSSSCGSILSGYCVKTKSTAGGQTAVTRYCLPSCPKLEVSGVITTCCDTDNCNAGMMTSFSIIALMMSLLMAYFAKARF